MYPDIADKAAALMHSLALNHPFVDGSKRVADFAAIVFVEANDHEFLATPDQLVETTLAVAEGKMAVDRSPRASGTAAPPRARASESPPGL